MKSKAVGDENGGMAMTNQAFEGFRPEPVEADRKSRESRLLAENLGLLQARAEEIISRPECFFCQLVIAYVSLPMISGEGPIPLGVLLQLWREGELQEPCSHCGGTVLVCGAGGDPFSGEHSWWGCCPDCQTWQNGSAQRFEDLWLPVRERRMQRPAAEIRPLDLETVLELLRQG